VSAVAILLAAGRGERLGAGVPKAFVEVAGESLLARAVATIERTPRAGGFVVAAPRGHEDEAKAVAARSRKLLTVVTGGETRQASVRLALHAVPAETTGVWCHDVARPFATPELYARVLGGLADADGAVPALPVADTVKRVRGAHVLETLPRDGLVLVQTPQAFRPEALEEAHRRAEEQGWEATDDAGLLEQAGFRVVVVPGDPGNFKITSVDDLARLRERAGG